MKKLLFFCATFVSFISCSNDDVISNEEQLVEVNIQIGMDVEKDITRSYFGTVSGKKDDGTYTIEHPFEEGDAMYLIEDGKVRNFSINAIGQTTTIHGWWSTDYELPIVVVYPRSAVADATNPVDVTLSDDKKSITSLSMHFNLPTIQHSRDLSETYQTTTGVSYDPSANISFACQNDKNASPNVIPLVSYLYFYSEKSSCTVYSTKKSIAGSYDVTYNGNPTYYNTVTSNNILEKLTIQQNNESTSRTIECFGKKIEGHKNKFEEKGYGGMYEYIIAFKPGYYDQRGIEILPQGHDDPVYNKTGTSFLPSHVYFLGCVD